MRFQDYPLSDRTIGVSRWPSADLAVRPDAIFPIWPPLSASQIRAAIPCKGYPRSYGTIATSGCFQGRPNLQEALRWRQEVRLRSGASRRWMAIVNARSQARAARAFRRRSGRFLKTANWPPRPDGRADKRLVQIALLRTSPNQQTLRGPLDGPFIFCPQALSFEPESRVIRRGEQHRLIAAVGHGSRAANQIEGGPWETGLLYPRQKTFCSRNRRPFSRKAERGGRFLDRRSPSPSPGGTHQRNQVSLVSRHAARTGGLVGERLGPLSGDRECQEGGVGNDRSGKRGRCPPVEFPLSLRQGGKIMRGLKLARGAEQIEDRNDRWVKQHRNDVALVLELVSSHDPQLSRS